MAAFRKVSVLLGNSTKVCSHFDLEKLRREFGNCRHKGLYPDGRPRPCRSQRCPCEGCRRAYARKEAAVLRRSFSLRPPHFNLTLSLTDDAPTFDTMMAGYLRTFTQKLRDFRKAGEEMDYDIRIEFRCGQPHAHLTIITSVGWSRWRVKEVFKGWWASSCPGRTTAVYCDRVRNVVGLANYLPKNVKDRRGVEMPPEWWNGRRCRLLWQSRGFLVASKSKLWREQVAEWFPQHDKQASEGQTGNPNHSRRSRRGRQWLWRVPPAILPPPSNHRSTTCRTGCGRASEYPRPLAPASGKRRTFWNHPWWHGKADRMTRGP